MFRYATILSSVLGAGAFLGCVHVSYEVNPEFCTNARGDETCADRFPDGSRPYCVVSACLDDFYGCFPEMPGEGCASPCGLENPDCEAGTTTGSSGSGTDSGTDSGESESGSDSTTTGPQPCMGDGDCLDDTAPFCEPTLSECVDCDGMPEPDMACAGLEAGTPACVEGECRQCTAAISEECTGDTPVCDEETNTCVPCTGHEQCESGACELAVGRCFPDGSAVTVDVDGGADYPSVVLAMASVADGAHGIIVVHDRDDGLGYQGALVDGGKTIAVLAAPGEAPIIQGTGGNPGLRVEGAGTALYVDGLEVSLAAMNGLGVTIDGAYAWIDRSRIVQNSGGGVLAQNGGELVLRSSFVGGNASDVDALALNASTLDMLYTTVGGGTVLGGRARALFCEGGATATVRNSILVSADPMPEVECAGVAIETSATETEAGTLDIGWFNGYAGGDFTLTEAGAVLFGETAVWLDGDPLADIEGDPRPGVVDSPDFAGADVVP